MDQIATKRIDTIRSNVREERALISRWEGCVMDRNLRRLLRPASHLLDDVESFFLSPKIRQEERSPAALAMWLREAKRVLQLARQQRRSFELIIKSLDRAAEFALTRRRPAQRQHGDVVGFRRAAGETIHLGLD